MNAIIELTHRIEGNDIYINDTMHAFKFNNPTSQLVSGQQKNGYYFC